MSLVGFKAQNHGQQVGARGALDKVDDRRTPPSLWDPLNAEFRFTLDVAASDENTLCRRYFTAEENGLERSWAGARVWCNPPYSDCASWVAKAASEFDGPGCVCPGGDACGGFSCGDGAAHLVVMLLPANRTEQGWWQRLVEPYRDRGGILTTRFLPGRLRFDTPPGTYSDPRGNRPPFGCVLLVWDVVGRSPHSRPVGRPEKIFFGGADRP